MKEDVHQRAREKEEGSYLLREINIMPSSESILFVPDTLAVPDEYKGVCWGCHGVVDDI